MPPKYPILRKQQHIKNTDVRVFDKKPQMSRRHMIATPRLYSPQT
jgi:hypothetical protein